MLNMLNMFKNLFSKHASFCGNVEYVERFLNLQTPFEHPKCLRGTQHSTLRLREAFFLKNAPFCGNVEYVEYVLGIVSKNVLLSAVMLNMLNVFGTYPPFPEKFNITTVRSIFF